MTIPKRNLRAIEVDGTTYYWTRSQKRRQQNGWVTVQNSEQDFGLLRIDLYGIPLPADIAEGIRFAISHGWGGLQKSRPIYLGFTTITEKPRFVLRSASSPDYWKEFLP